MKIADRGKATNDNVVDVQIRLYPVEYKDGRTVHVKGNLSQSLTVKATKVSDVFAVIKKAIHEG